MNFGIEQLAFTFDLIGKALIGIAVLRVHGKLGHDKRVDRAVLRSIKREQWWTYFGLLFLILGWVLHLMR